MKNGKILHFLMPLVVNVVYLVEFPTIFNKSKMRYDVFEYFLSIGALKIGCFNMIL